MNWGGGEGARIFLIYLQSQFCVLKCRSVNYIDSTLFFSVVTVYSHIHAFLIHC